MNKLEYIPGDIVKIEYGEATGKIGFVTNTFLRRKGCYSLVVFIGKGFQGSSKDDWIQTYNDEVSPIPLTPEILEKNGWKLSHGFYWSPNEEGAEVGLSSQTGYVWNAYMRSYPLRSGINSVSDLQHLLFGLGLDSNMIV